MPKVYITSPVPGDAVSILRAHHFTVEENNSWEDLGSKDLKKVFGEVDAVLTLVNDKIDEEVIAAASPKLRVISNFAVGFDNIDVLAAKKKGIIVTNTPGVANESVAEHAISLMLACSKQIVEADKYVRAGKFIKWDPNLFLSGQIWGKTMGIVGLGKIGTFLGHMVKGGFNMNILYYDITRSEDFELLNEARFASLETVLKHADVVSLHVPLTSHTKHLIGKEELKSMKNTAILINTSRGPIVNEETLIWALREKEIAAAGLDVYENEPHVPDELRTLSNVILTPHTASATIETRNTMSRIAAENIIDVFTGKEPVGLVKVN